MALKAQWNYWDNSGGSVVAPSAESIPARPDGIDRAVKWYKPASSDQVYQKLNRVFNVTNWPTGLPSYDPHDTSPGADSPPDVSGIYTVWQYIPSAKFKLNPGHGWVITSEFKEAYRVNGVWHQNGTYGLCWDNFSGAVRGGVTPGNTGALLLSDYMDRWVKWEWRLYQGAKDTTGHGGRIELWADGVLKETRYESTRHVGSGTYSSLAETEGWIWIAGQYSSNQHTNGVPDYMGTDVTSYVGGSTMTPLR